MNKNLKSSALEVGETSTQIICFKNGEEKTFENVDNNSIKVGRFTKFKIKGKNIICNINHREVNWFEVHGE